MSTPPAPRRESWWGSFAIGASLLALGLCMFAALALAVFEQFPDSLDRYLAIKPGDAALYHVSYADGSDGLLSQNVFRPSSEATAYAAVYAGGGTAVQVRSVYTNWQGSGEAYGREDFYSRQDETLKWIAQHLPDGKIIFDLAIPIWSPALFRSAASDPWANDTAVNDSSFRIRQWSPGDESVTLSDGHSFAAVRVETEALLNEQTLSRVSGWYVRGLGLVRSEEYDGNGALVLRLELLNSTRLTDAAQRGTLPAPASNATAFYREDAARTGAHLDVLLPANPAFAVTGHYAGGAAFTASPVFADGLLYVADQNGQLLALEADLSAPRWVFGVDGAFVAAPAIADGRLFIGASDKVLYALDAATGLYLWSARFQDNLAASPASAGGLVFAPCEDRTLYALDAASGAPRWTFRAEDRLVSSPAMADGRLFLGSDDQLVYALEAQTGRELWRAALDSSIVAAPAVADGVVYAASTDRTAAAFEAGTGKMLWTTESRFGYVASPAVGQQAVYVADEDGNLRALDRQTGAILWEWVGDYGVTFVSSPLVLGDRVVAIDGNGSLRVWDTVSGQVLNQMELGGSVTASPTWNGATLFITTQNKDVLILEP